MYKKSRKLGEGAFGTVYLGTSGDEQVAIKQYKLETINGIRPEILREIAILSWANHPNLIKLVNIKLAETIEITLEYGGQTLRDFINTTDLVSRIGRFESIKLDIFAGLEYLHKHGIFHRDIKPSNILIDHERTRLCDFGLTKPISNQWTPSVGTLNYRAPEIFSNNHYGTNSDIWSVGCCLYEYFKKEYLFAGTTDIAVLTSIVRTVPVDPELLVKLHLEIINPANCNTTRYYKINSLYDESLTNIEHRRFLDRVKQQIEAMLILNPDIRPTIFEILNKPVPSQVRLHYERTPFNYRIVELAKPHQIKPETIHIASYIFDTAMTTLIQDSPVDRSAGLKALDRIATTCLVIASKMLDTKYLKYQTIAKHDQIKSLLEWEIYCLKATKWMKFEFK